MRFAAAVKQEVTGKQSHVDGASYLVGIQPSSLARNQNECSRNPNNPDGRKTARQLCVQKTTRHQALAKDLGALR
eukprot:4068919-Pyramimonas_sp.AAC.1